MLSVILLYEQRFLGASIVIAIDTCSLMSLAWYYLPFDRDSTKFLPGKKFLHYADNDFWNPVAKKKLTKELKAVKKTKFLEGGRC